MEDKELIKLIDEKVATRLNNKIFYAFLTIIVLVVGSIFGLIGGLYSNQGALTVQLTNRLTTIETSLKYVQEDIKDIKDTLKKDFIIE